MGIFLSTAEMREEKRRLRVQRYVDLLNISCNRRPPDDKLTEEILVSYNYFGTNFLIGVQAEGEPDIGEYDINRPPLSNDFRRQSRGEPQRENEYNRKGFLQSIKREPPRVNEVGNAAMKTRLYFDPKPTEPVGTFNNKEKPVSITRPSVKPNALADPIKTEINKYPQYEPSQTPVKFPITQLAPKPQPSINSFNPSNSPPKNPSGRFSSPILKTNPKDRQIPEPSFHNPGQLVMENPLTTIYNPSESPITHPASSNYCTSCRNIPGVTKECPHTLCAPCLQESFKKVSNGSFLGRMRCQTCTCVIPTDKYLDKKLLYTYQAKAVDDLQSKFAVDATEPHVSCQICQEDVLVSDSITLECDHRFCADCIKDFITQELKSCNLKGLGCPDCSKKITYDEIKANVDKDTFELYLVLTTRGYKPDDMTCYLKECFICGAFYEIPKNLKLFECLNCKRSYCPQCNNNHPGVSCAEYLSKAQPNFGDMMIVQCPKCKEAINLDPNGCNFVKCMWSGCLNNFCALCLESLEPSAHYTHYQRSGPFGKTCNTLDGLSQT